MKVIAKAGFSLLELILALALTVIIFASIAGSFHVFLYTLTDQQRDLEQHQVARNIMQMIGNDLRAALQYKPNDVTGVQNLSASELLVGGILEGTDESDIILLNSFADLEEAAAGESGVESETEELTEEEEEALSDCANCRPTLIGTETSVTVDISRMPRLDEYNTEIVSNQDKVQLPSDLKAISYFVGRPSGSDSRGSGNSLFNDEVNQMGGLYRRNIDRAVANFAGEEGIMEDADDFADLIAPEVVELTFRYFDGEDWNTEWDNLERGGFPLAVEIVVTLDPERINSDSPDQYQGFDPDTMLRYRSVVNLPVSEIIEEEE